MVRGGVLGDGVLRGGVPGLKIDSDLLQASSGARDTAGLGKRPGETRQAEQSF